MFSYLLLAKQLRFDQISCFPLGAERTSASIMSKFLIIGSGPAAAGTALALSKDRRNEITVIDIGARLEDRSSETVASLAGKSPSDWGRREIEEISAQPRGVEIRGLPEKRSYGSDFPFRNFGQLDDIFSEGQVNSAVVSGAYGGLSNVWGSQVMAFTDGSFRSWPVSLTEMLPHYGEILRHIPYAAEEDELSEHFPLIEKGKPLPKLSSRTEAVLRSSERRRGELNRMGVQVGKARLAFNSEACVRCGLCMTGCPYSLIYSASQTFDELRAQRRIAYHSGLLAFQIGQDDETPFADARDLANGNIHRFEADRIFVACGSMGTTRLMFGSIPMYGQQLRLMESAQFAIPMLSMHPTEDPRADTEFTLNQFNMVIATDEDWIDVSQVHFYPFNPAVLDALPKPLTRPSLEPLLAHVLRRTTVGLGYIPSWHSPQIRVSAEPAMNVGELPRMNISGEPLSVGNSVMFRKVLRKMVRSGPLLDLWPLIPAMFTAAAGKSYHFGGSFPHRRSSADGTFTTDSLGRLDQWSRVHLVDAAVFPSVPATTFTLTIMANAHRIASQASQLVQ
jgi:ferredoxin